jgi:hypothetical protein
MGTSPQKQERLIIENDLEAKPKTITSELKFDSNSRENDHEIKHLGKSCFYKKRNRNERNEKIFGLHPDEEDHK